MIAHKPEQNMEKVIDRVIGSILGLAAGDALGSTVEFMSQAEILAQYGPGGQTEMRGGGAFGWAVGECTDDGQMMIALMESLIATNGRLAAPVGLDVDDLGRRFVAWLNSNPPDVGNTTYAALERLRDGTPAAEAGDPNPQSQANGAVMRCAPVAVLWYKPDQRAALVRDSLLSAAPTHRSAVAADACVVVNTMIAEFINGADFETALSAAKLTANPEWQKLLQEWEQAGRPHRGNSGWAVSTVLTALHCLVTTHSYEEAVIKAVNGGDDADTVGAVTGELAGAFYGIRGIPARWRSVLKSGDKDYEDMMDMAVRLFEIGERG